MNRRPNGIKHLEMRDLHMKSNRFLKITYKAYCTIYKIMWKENLLLSIVDIFHGMSFAILVIVTQKFFDGIVQYISGNSSEKQILFLASLVIGVQIMSQLLNGFVNFYAEVVQEKSYGKLCVILQKKLEKVSPLEFEKNDFLDNINKAEQGARGTCEMVDIINSIFTFYIPYFGVMGIYMYQLHGILVTALLCVFVPVFVSNFVHVYFGSKTENEIAPYRRESVSYQDTLLGLECFKETRVLGATKYFLDKYNLSITRLNRFTWHNKKKETIIELCLNIFSFLSYGGVLAFLVYCCIKDIISVGAFAAVFSSIDVMFYLMEEIFKDSMGDVSQKIGMVNNFLKLLQFQAVERKSVPVLSGGIELKNVLFQYPEADKPCLKNISLKVNENELVAIVGENGSGKTTLSKIMIGLYTPNDGEIYISGRKLEPVSEVIYEDTSVVFQDFNKYKLLLGENITISDLKSKKSYIKALHSVDEDLRIKDDVILSRDFEGIDLSGGQWQKVALARGIYRNRKILLLDEPTAAIDPIQENDLYDCFIEIAKGKTCIIVTHRLGLARIADRIVVLKNGEIIENGTHDQLLHSKGQYYKMWNAQARWYNKTEGE